MNEAYLKVVNTILSASIISLEAGSVKNLINNFTNMYNDTHSTECLNIIYNQKLKEYEL